MDWRGWYARRNGLVWPMLGKPLQATPLGLALFSLLSHARLLIKTATLELAKQPFTGQLLLRDLQGFLNVVIKDLDLHWIETTSLTECLYTSFPTESALVYHTPSQATRFYFHLSESP